MNVKGTFGKAFKSIAADAKTGAKNLGQNVFEELVGTKIASKVFPKKEEEQKPEEPEKKENKEGKLFLKEQKNQSTSLRKIVTETKTTNTILNQKLDIPAVGSQLQAPVNVKPVELPKQNQILDASGQPVRASSSSGLTEDKKVEQAKEANVALEKQTKGINKIAKSTSAMEKLLTEMLKQQKEMQEKGGGGLAGSLLDLVGLGGGKGGGPKGSPKPAGRGRLGRIGSLAKSIGGAGLNTVKSVGGSVLRKAPVIGTVLGAGVAATQAAGGDYKGATGTVGSVVGGIVGGIAGSVLGPAGTIGGGVAGAAAGQAIASKAYDFFTGGSKPAVNEPTISRAPTTRPASSSKATPSQARGGKGPQAAPSQKPSSSALSKTFSDKGGKVGKTSGKDKFVIGDDVAKAIDMASKKVGVSRSIMYSMARQESGFNPNAKAGTSSASGLFQFIKGTWNEMVSKYGDQYPELSRGPFDPLASAIAGALFIKQNSKVLQKAGVPINGTTVYAAHFLGAGGAKQLFTAPPDAIAANLFPAAAKANQYIFFDKKQNNRPKTVAEVQQTLFDKVGKYADMYAAQIGEEGVSSGATPSEPDSSAPLMMQGKTPETQAAAGNSGSAGAGASVVAAATTPKTSAAPTAGAEAPAQKQASIQPAVSSERAVGQKAEAVMAMPSAPTQQPSVSGPVSNTTIVAGGGGKSETPPIVSSISSIDTYYMNILKMVPV